MKSRLFCLLALGLLIVSCKKNDDSLEEDDLYTPPVVTPYTPDNSFKIVAYMPSYKDPAMVGDKKYKMVTHLFYAFLQPQEIADGSLKPLSQPGRFAVVAQKAKTNHVKFGISVSGTKSTFENIAKSANARTTFVNNIVTFAKNNNLDGVDMDWEYPSTATGVESADNFTLLMKELSVALHNEGKFISAAVTSGIYEGSIRDGIKAAVFPWIDFFNIMQYNGQAWDQDEPYQHASYKMSEYSLEVWLNMKGLPKNKAVVGIPLYGKNNKGDIKTYRELEEGGVDVKLDMGTFSGITYWFNGIHTVKQKVQLAKNRANGIMFWEFSQDTNNDNALIKVANDQLDRNYK